MVPGLGVSDCPVGGIAETVTTTLLNNYIHITTFKHRAILFYKLERYIIQTNLLFKTTGLEKSKETQMMCTFYQHH